MLIKQTSEPLITFGHVTCYMEANYNDNEARFDKMKS